MLARRRYTDFTFYIGENKFPVHRVILATRSPVFAAMFELKDTKEQQERMVRLVDCNEETFQALLEYIYAETMPPPDKLTVELMATADKV